MKQALVVGMSFEGFTKFLEAYTESVIPVVLTDDERKAAFMRLSESVLQVVNDNKECFPAEIALMLLMLSVEQLKDICKSKAAYEQATKPGSKPS